MVAKVEWRPDARAKLDGYKTTRREGNFTLKSQVTVDERVARSRRDGTLVSGTVFDEYLRPSRRLIEGRDGTYRVEDMRTVQDVQWGRFWLAERGFLIAQRYDTAAFTFRVLKSALERPIEQVILDIQRMAQAFRGHWLGAISGRRGHVQAATMYGDSIEDDDEMGNAYRQNKKRQIGFWTDYFPGRTKVKVTLQGSVTVYADLQDDRPAYVAFVKDVILPYVS